MDLSTPWRDVSPTVTGDVLVALVGAQRPLTGRDVAEKANRGTSAVAAALRDLAESGLVRTHTVGRSIAHELEHDHVLAPAARAMAGARRELYRRISHLVGEWETPPVNVTVFGSTVSGGATRASDIDVLVVRSDDEADTDDCWTSRLGILATSIERWTGNPAEVLDYTLQQLLDLSDSGSDFPGEAAAGRTVTGDPLHRILVRNRLDP